MKIKPGKQLVPGDVIKWDVVSATPLDDYTTGRRVAKEVEIQVIEVYAHHVLFRILQPPYLKLDIQNVQLYQKGIYKTADLLNPFVRYEDE